MQDEWPASGAWVAPGSKASFPMSGRSTREAGCPYTRGRSLYPRIHPACPHSVSLIASAGTERAASHECPRPVDLVPLRSTNQ